MTIHTNIAHTIYGIIAEFADADQLVAAARQVHQQGYRRLEAYSPFPVEGLAEITVRAGGACP